MFDINGATINRHEPSQFPNIMACSDANDVIAEDKILI